MVNFLNGQTITIMGRKLKEKNTVNSETIALV